MTTCCGYWCKWGEKDIKVIVSVSTFLMWSLEKLNSPMLLASYCHWTVPFWRWRRIWLYALNRSQWPFAITSQRQGKFGETWRVASLRQASLLPHILLHLISCTALCFPEPPRSTCSDTSFEVSLQYPTEGTWYIQCQLWAPYGKTIPYTYAQSVSEARRRVEECGTSLALSLRCLWTF